MQCDEFNPLLPDLLSGNVTQTERDVCEAHIQECGRCGASFAMASAAQFEAQDSDVLLKRIVQATTPELCEISASLLCDSLDESLNPGQLILLNSHLEDCYPCQQLNKHLQLVHINLPMLADLRPPDSLLSGILQKTSHRRQPEKSWLLQSLERLRLVLLRPRIALEASFAATLLWTILFGVPAPVLDTAFAEQPTVIERLELQKIWNKTQTGLEREIIGLAPDLSRPVTALADNGEQLVHDTVANVKVFGAGIWRNLNDWVENLPNRFSPEHLNNNEN